MFYVTNNIDGSLDERAKFNTREAAELFIEKLEAKDKESGSYTEGFYVIVDEESV